MFLVNCYIHHVNIAVILGGQIAIDVSSDFEYHNPVQIDVSWKDPADGVPHSLFAFHTR
jgi:hypothetical protein